MAILDIKSLNTNIPVRKTFFLNRSNMYLYQLTQLSKCANYVSTDSILNLINKKFVVL